MVALLQRRAVHHDCAPWRGPPTLKRKAEVDVERAHKAQVKDRLPGAVRDAVKRGLQGGPVRRCRHEPQVQGVLALIAVVDPRFLPDDGGDLFELLCRNAKCCECRGTGGVGPHRGSDTGDLALLGKARQTLDHVGLGQPEQIGQRRKGVRHQRQVALKAVKQGCVAGVETGGHGL